MRKKTVTKAGVLPVRKIEVGSLIEPKMGRKPRGPKIAQSPKSNLLRRKIKRKRV